MTEVTQADLLRMFEYRDGQLFWRSARGSVSSGTAAGCLGGDGYVLVRVLGRLYKRSRLVFLMHHGRLPQPMVDHINRVRADDRIENLREADHHQNNFNKDSKGFTKVGARWMSQIKRDGVNHYLGLHETAEAARAAYLQAKQQMEN